MSDVTPPEQKDTAEDKGKAPVDNTVPNGYRQAIVTAITVFLAFELAFLRFWAHETTGGWNEGSISVSIIFIGSIVMSTIALVRALSLEDDDKAEYRRTVYRFKWGVGAAIVGAVIGVFLSMSEPPPECEPVPSLYYSPHGEGGGVTLPPEPPH